MTLQMIYQEKYEMGVKDGIEQGIEMINKLHDILIEQNRLEDWKRAIEDKGFAKELIKELL